MHERRRRPLAALLAISLAAAPFAAFAGPAEDKATARDLAKEGIAAEQEGDCKTAIDRLERAESMYHAPPHLQHLARCYQKTGRLVDATETWRKLTLEVLPPNSPPAFKEAITEAQTELPKLEPRLARLTIKTDKAYPEFAVEVDGKSWPSAAVGVARVIDPGKHTLSARATGFAKTEQEVQLEEGKSDEITVTLTPEAPKPIPSASTSASAKPSTSASASSSAPPSTAGPWKTIGLVAGGTGVVMVIGGVVTGLLGKSKVDQLDKDCNGHRANCAVPDLEGRKSTIRTYQTTTNVLLIGGGVLAAAGIGLFLLAPSPKSSGPSVSLQFAPGPQGGHVALTGSF
ncbi:MAG: hypothetical protein ACXWUG_09195 [Polyangiales bacterium]